ncbi:S-methyl-5-thioribose-1-phosphate isomerase [Nocardiopsis trehalosi]|jgi:methylthioribose-1-phosphate isomerase|uniref:S-methyl-5-thioribose-1-phosphate isomerase n=1 Tax=Nocardiopsis trehalosi TaxID=109329 RepID=UPI00082B0F27|nr:S-methyl-5-thioribose-1-phosphate isomerase [Nocardiopsis trehalosi]
MPDATAPLAWTGTALRLLDQTRLPADEVHLHVTTVDDLVDAITRLAVRGAPALGAAGAYGVAIALRQAEREGWTGAALDAAVDRVRDARPTAVNLARAVDRVRPLLAQGADAVIRAADALVAAETAANDRIAANGADYLLDRCPRRPLRLLTHCNTGPLAAPGRGTALGVAAELHDRGTLALVYADETRPLLQGARLTAWELARLGIPHAVQADGAAAATILGGHVDAAVVGADRVAANGDTANKIGTLAVALACADAGVPFLVAAPSSTVDPTTPTGADIPIELRPEEEVLEWQGRRTAPAGTRGHNPAFDVTPARLVTALVTERRAFEIARGDLPPAGVGPGW